LKTRNVFHGDGKYTFFLKYNNIKLLPLKCNINITFKKNRMKRIVIYLVLVVSLVSTSNLVAQVTAYQPSDIVMCGENGFAVFDLTHTEPAIIGGQDPANLFVTYYITQQDADNGTNVIVVPESFPNSVNPQTIYARLEDNTNGDFDTTSFNIFVLETPIIFAPTPLEMCDITEITGPDDEIEPFDLESKTDEITGGNENIYITYHETQADADSGTFALISPYINFFNPHTIYIRAENVTTSCIVSQGITLDLIVNPLPSPIAPEPLVVCDEGNDGFEVFILTDRDDEITGGDPDLLVSYHYVLQDAENGINPLASPYYNDVPFAQIVYARVENIDSGCFAIIPMELIVESTPEAENILDLEAVDVDGDGFVFFDLTSKIPEILNGQTDVNVTFYETEADANNNVTIIANPENYMNITNPQTIYTRLENTESCFAVGEFDLVLVDVIIDEEPDNLYINEGDDDGLAIFDLTVNESQMLGDQDPLVALFSYYITLADSENDVNRISLPTAYQNITNPQTIFVRLTNSNSGNYVLTNFEIQTDGVLGVDENFNNSFKLYPNPSTGIINVQSNNLTEAVEVAIYNLQGQVLISERKTPENGTISFDVSGLSTGVYFIKIVLEDVSVIKRIVKQ